MGTVWVALIGLGVCGQGKVSGFTYSCPAVYLSAQYADKTGNMLTDGKIGPGNTVIYSHADNPVISVVLPIPHRIDRVVAYCHRHNDNYKCRYVRLYVQQGGLWLEADEKAGFMQPFDPAQPNFAIELEGKHMTTEALRIVFAVAGILSISEIEVFGTPAGAEEANNRAQVVTRPPSPLASVSELDADGDGKLDIMLENRWVRMIVSPSRGGVVRSFIYHPTGEDLVCAEGANFGLLREQLWKPSYFFADNPCAAQHGQAQGMAWAETAITGAGGMMGFTHTRKRITLCDDSSVVQVEWEIKNDPSSMTRYEYGPWMHNWVGGAGSRTRYFVPTVEGVKEFVLQPGTLKEQVNLWYWEPARGWMALISDASKKNMPATGLAFVVPYSDLACFYHWAGVSSVAATAEWRHGLVNLAAGESFLARYLIVPFHGLSRVDGVCPLIPRETTPAPVSVAVGCIDCQGEGGKADARVAVFTSPGAPSAEAVVRWRMHPDGPWQELARKPLQAGEATEVFAGEIPGAAGRAVIVSCQIVSGSRVLDDFQRLLNLSGNRVAYRLEPHEKRTARVESTADEALPRHDLQPSVVTPHVAWARPYARGPIRAIVLCDDQNAREVIELAQRLDLDFTYIKFRTTRETEWIYQGDRTVPNLETAQRRLLKALEEPFDVAVIAGFDWQVHFTPDIRARLAEKVQAGMGLVAIEPCGVPADDPLAEALGISEQDRPLSRFYTWKREDSDDISRGLPWPWEMAQAFDRLVPRTRRMEYARPPKGKGWVYEEDGTPLLTTAQVGKGRVVTATYDVLTHAMSYRGFSALTPIISYRGQLLLPEYEEMTWPYWEHWWVLITRMVVWAAAKECPARLENIAAEVNQAGRVVAHFTASGEEKGDFAATLQLTDKYGVAITEGASKPEPKMELALSGLWTAPLFRDVRSVDELNLLRFGSREVEVERGAQVKVDLGPARAGWNFVRIVLRDKASGAAVDWALVPVRNDNVPVTVKSLNVDRDPVTDCRMLLDKGQPWARVFVPEKSLMLNVDLQAVTPVDRCWRVRAELYDNHARLLYVGEQEVSPDGRPLSFMFMPSELRNMGLEWRVTVLRAQGEKTEVVDTARRRLLAVPPRVWNRFSFTSWSANFLTRCFWLHEYLMPIVEELGIDVGMDSSSELMAGKSYRNKWHNIEHSYIGLLDYPGQGIPGFRDNNFGEKSAKYAQTKDKSLLVRQPCLNDPEYREKLAQGLKERIKEAAKIGFSYDYCMGDEMSLTNYTRYFDYCFSPHTLAAFREWLKLRYKTLNELNRAWETNFGDWEEVQPMTLDEVRGRANAAPWAEFRTFMNDNLAGFYAFVQKTIREVDPEAKCGLSGTQEPKPGNGMDWWKLSRAFSYYHSYNTGWSNEMRRSFAVATGVMQTPYYAGYWQSGRALEYNMFWCLLHDTKGVSCWTTPLLIYPDFTLTEAGEDTRRFVHELRDGLWDYVRAGERLDDGIAIHYSQPSINAALLMDRDSHIVQVRDAWVKLIEDMGLQYQFVAYEQIEQGELTRTPGRYKVLILPESIALSPQEVEEIRRFVLAGGTIVADGWCGLMDDKCRRLERPALDELFGISRGTQAEGGDTVKISTKLTGQDMELRMRAAETELRDAKQFFGDSRGVPVFIASPVGKGRAWYLNLDLSSWPLDRRTGTPTESMLRLAMGRVFSQAGVQVPVAVSYSSGRPTHVEVVRYRLAEVASEDSKASAQGGFPGAGLIVGLLRDRNDDTDEIATVAWREERHVYDLRAHKYLGRLRQLTVPLAPGECRLLLLTQRAIEAPRVEVRTRRVPLGGRVEVSVTPTVQSYMPQLVRMEVMDPDTKEQGDYAQNLLLRGKRITAGFFLALNDPVGLWTVRLRDAASGHTTEAHITVGE